MTKDTAFSKKDSAFSDFVAELRLEMDPQVIDDLDFFADSATCLRCRQSYSVGAIPESKIFRRSFCTACRLAEIERAS